MKSASGIQAKSINSFSGEYNLLQRPCIPLVMVALVRHDKITSSFCSGVLLIAWQDFALTGAAIAPNTSHLFCFALRRVC